MSRTSFDVSFDEAQRGASYHLYTLEDEEGRIRPLVCLCVVSPNALADHLWDSANGELLISLRLAGSEGLYRIVTRVDMDIDLTTLRLNASTRNQVPGSKYAWRREHPGIDLAYGNMAVLVDGESGVHIEQLAGGFLSWRLGEGELRERIADAYRPALEDLARRCDGVVAECVRNALGPERLKR